MRALLTLLTLLALPTWAAPPTVVGQTGQANASGATETLSVTIPSGTDRAMYCLLSKDTAAAATLTGTFNGDAMATLEESAGTGQQLSLLRITAPDEVTGNVVISGVTSGIRVIACVWLTGVDQTTPEGTPELIESGSGTSITSAGLSTTTDDVVLTFLANNNDSTNVATGTGHTRTVYNNVASQATAIGVVAGTGGTVTPGYTYANNRATFIAVVVHGVSGGGDTMPDAFSFTDQTNVALSSTITSAAVTITGIDTEISCTATGGTIDLNSDGNFQTSQDVNVDDEIRARHTSSGSNSTAVNTVVDCGTGPVSDTFTSTTEAAVGSSIVPIIEHYRRQQQ